MDQFDSIRIGEDCADELGREEDESWQAARTP